MLWAETPTAQPLLWLRGRARSTRLNTDRGSFVGLRRHEHPPTDSYVQVPWSTRTRSVGFDAIGFGRYFCCGRYGIWDQLATCCGTRVRSNSRKLWHCVRSNSNRRLVTFAACQPRRIQRHSDVDAGGAGANAAESRLLHHRRFRRNYAGAEPAIRLNPRSCVSRASKPTCSALA